MATILRPRSREPRQHHGARARQSRDPQPGSGERLLPVGHGLYPRPVSVPRHQQHVGQCRQEPVPSADRRAAGAARPCRHRRRPTAEALLRPPAGRSRSSSPTPSSSSRSTTTTSRRPARGATSSGSTSRTRSGSARSISASPMSSSPCRKGTAKGIAKFYRKVLGALTCMEKNGHGKAAHIKVGPKQELIFRETDKALPEFDGHHLQVYVEDFGTPHDKLKKLDLITEESDRCQYRFEDIVDARYRQGAVHDRARNPQHDPPALLRAGWSTATRRRPTATTSWAATSGSIIWPTRSARAAGPRTR